MDLATFKASIAVAQPPAGLDAPLEALWHAAHGDWKRAHSLAQTGEGDASHDWVHAYLHRVEGDLANARSWYRSCGREPATGTLEAEWAEIATALLARPA